MVVVVLEGGGLEPPLRGRVVGVVAGGVVVGGVVGDGLGLGLGLDPGGDEAGGGVVPELAPGEPEVESAYCEFVLGCGP